MSKASSGSLSASAGSTSSMGIVTLGVSVPRALPSPMRPISLGEVIDNATRINPYEIKRPKIEYDSGNGYQIPSYGRNVSDAYSKINLRTKSFGTDGGYALTRYMPSEAYNTEASYKELKNYNSN